MSPQRPPGSGPAPAPQPEEPGPAQPAATRVPALPAVPRTTPLPATGRVKVRAREMGYYGLIRRRPGDVFWLEDVSAYAPWMQIVDLEEPERITLGNDAIREERDQRVTARMRAQAIDRGEGLTRPLPPTGDANPLADEG